MSGGMAASSRESVERPLLVENVQTHGTVSPALVSATVEPLQDFAHMSHWLTSVRRALTASDRPVAGRRALILGDPMHRAASICESAGMVVVRGITAHGVAARRFLDERQDLVVRTSASALPFTADTFELVIAHATVEFSHDDRQVIAELARVLRPGGRLVVRLPFQGRLTALDALNLYRYTREVTGRGDIPPEALPIGWRRHYTYEDLAAILPEATLSVERRDHGGLGLGELAYWPGLVLTRSVIQRPGATQRLRGLYARFGDLDDHLPGPATITVTARRLPKATGSPSSSGR